MTSKPSLARTPSSYRLVVKQLLIISLLLISGQAMAQTQISEIRIDQPGTDNDEYFELSGPASGSLDGLTYIVIGDGAGGSGTIESVTPLDGSALSASGFFVAAEGTFTIGTADLTASLGFENSDNVTHLLVSDFTGSNGDDLDTNDDGTLDVTPWTAIESCVALVETPSSGELFYCDDTVGPDGNFVPGHSMQCPTGWVIGEFDPTTGDDTPGAPNDCGLAINEVRIDQSGSDDDEYFELSGTPDSSLDGLTYLVIGDGTGLSGSIESVTPLTGSVVPASGYFVAAESTFTLGTADLTTVLNHENSDNVTHLLVSNFTGANGDDLDTDDDGVLDVEPWDAIVSCVALVETVGSGEQVYCDATVGPDGTFVPGHVFFCPHGWEIGSFTVGTDDTPGAENVCVIPDDVPAVSSTTPADGASGVPVDADIVVDFSEDVLASDPWFTITCTDNGVVTASPSGGPSSYTLNPDADFTESESCDVVIIAAQVTDVDDDDPPDTMASDFSFTFTVTGPPVQSPMVINELDSDQSGTDSAEFVELYDSGLGITSLDGLVLVMYNGSNDTSYLAYDLDGLTTGADGFLVLCGDTANVANCDVDIGSNTNLVQNGADAVALYQADGTDFPNGTPVTTTSLIDAVVYDTNDSDDTGLASLMNPGEPQVNEDGAGDKDNHSNQRCPNGAGGGRNTSTFITAEPTPGESNDCIFPLINEVDADSPGVDTAEFVELLTPGAANFPLDGYSLVLYNGSDDASYLAFDLDGLSTDENGYFVLCGNAANVANCDLDVTPNSDLIQNGADAVALVYGDAVDYPNDTPVTTSGLVDALVYDTNDGDDAGLLVLLNAGQPQINEDGAGDKDIHSNQRCPNGIDAARDTSTYVQAVATPGVVNGCGSLEIHQIQGAGSVSDYDGFDVLTADNIVTAVGPDGFFIQAPDARMDNNIDTSEGIYVFTDTAPAVSVGDSVDVLGRVVEFFDFTEFTNNPVVTVNSSGNPLPSAKVLDASVPSTNPMVGSCAIEFECYEGMLVQVSNGTVANGNRTFVSDPFAEVNITAASTRTFREPGVIYPGAAGSVYTWDGNPEMFELDADKLGLGNAMIPGGSRFSATGVIGFEFGDYELWPTALSVVPAMSPRAVRAKASGETTVGSYNLLRFATDGEYSTRLEKHAMYILDVLDAPDILGVQEADDLSSLQDLAAAINTRDGSVNYTAYLVEGNDQGGIDVGFMVRDGVEVNTVTQLGKDEIFAYDNSLLHDRPPLLLEASYVGNGGAFPLAVLVLHIRSLNGIETERVQLKRLTQAESIAQMAQDFQTANPAIPLVVVGDFNAFEFTDGYADVVGTIKGDFDPTASIQTGADLVNPNLVNQVDLLPAGERYSYVYQGNAQALDHALTSQSAQTWFRGMAYGRGNADAALVFSDDPLTPQRASDHDGLVVYLMTDTDGDLVADDLDACPMNPDLVEWNPDTGCATPIPALSPIGLLLMWLLLGGLAGFVIRRGRFV